MNEDMVSYHCNRCKDTWMAPGEERKEWWENLVTKREGIIPELGVIRWLQKNSNLEEKDFKNIAAHQVKEFGKCCDCGHTLPVEGVSECRFCGAINFNFKVSQSNQ